MLMATTLERKAYRRYMQTNRWQELRATVLERDGHACQRCGSKRNLQVHHLTYQRVYSESPDDLLTLCRWCHGSSHEHAQKNKSSAGVCRGCGEVMAKPWWGPGGGYYCGYACKGRN